MVVGLEIWCATEDLFLCLGSNLGKDHNSGSASERGSPLANRCYLCLEQEETMDHLLIHCIKTRSLWELLFSLFGVTWVNPLSH